MSTQYGSISGRVVNTSGAPVVGASVAVTGSPQPHRDIAAVTNADGRFRLGGLRPGSYQLTVHARDLTQSVHVVVTAGTLAEVEIGLARPDVVLGTDTRVRVTNIESYPWRCICSLLITARTGTQHLGTGWLASPRVVLTAGQCVYMRDEGGWASQIEVVPGRNGDARPFGSATSRDLRSVPGWVEYNDVDYDYGAILLPADKRFGETLGWFGYTIRPNDYLRQVTLNLSGYPADGGGTQRFATGVVNDVMATHITYELDTTEGQSGAPVWETTSEGNRFGVAIHAESRDTTINRGVRITSEVFDNIVLWISQAP